MTLKIAKETLAKMADELSLAVQGAGEAKLPHRTACTALATGCGPSEYTCRPCTNKN